MGKPITPRVLFCYCKIIEWWQKEKVKRWMLIFGEKMRGKAEAFLETIGLVKLIIFLQRIGLWK
jgi:hypothetical protein